MLCSILLPNRSSVPKACCTKTTAFHRLSQCLVTLVRTSNVMHPSLYLSTVLRVFALAPPLYGSMTTTVDSTWCAQHHHITSRASASFRGKWNHSYALITLSLDSAQSISRRLFRLSRLITSCWKVIVVVAGAELRLVSSVTSLAGKTADRLHS